MNSAYQTLNQGCNEQAKPAAGKLECSIVIRMTSRDLNGTAAERVRFWGRTHVLKPICIFAVFLGSSTLIALQERYPKNPHQGLHRWEIL